MAAVDHAQNAERAGIRARGVQLDFTFHYSQLRGGCRSAAEYSARAQTGAVPAVATGAASVLGETINQPPRQIVSHGTPSLSPSRWPHPH